MATYATSSLARLRGLSDAMLMLIAQIESTESQKRHLPTDHPMFMDLSTEVVRLAEELYAAAREEEAAARIADKQGPLSDYDPAHLQGIMEDWNSVRGALRVAEPGTEEARRLGDVATNLRREFLEIVRTTAGGTADEAERTTASPSGAAWPRNEP